MNKRINVCPKDVHNLKILTGEGLVASSDQPTNYRDRVVLKPWGYEFLVFENECVAIWFLHIKEGHSTSMHCHPQKKTALTVLSGEVFCNTFLTRDNLKAMDGVVFEKGVFHSTTSVSPDGIFLLEMETPPNKTDLVRFNDRYGRVKEGYEPNSQMAESELQRYGHFYFTETDQPEVKAEKFNVGLHCFSTNEEFANGFTITENEQVLICRGTILWDDEHRLTAGEVFDRSSFAGLKRWIHEPVTLMKVRGK